MSLHVIVENRNTKMPHTGFSQRARLSLLRRLTAPSSITEGRISLLSCPLGQGVGRGPGRSLAAPLAQSPPFSSLTASAEGLEGAGTPSTDSVQKHQDFKLAGLRIGPGTPQEHSEQGRCQTPAGTPGTPPAPKIGSAAPWAPHRCSAPSWDTLLSC